MIDEIALVGKPLLNFDVVDEDDTEQSSCDEVVGLTSLSKFSEKEKSVDSSVKPLHKVLTTPAVRRISKEKNVVLSSVQATGRNGRILKGDM